MNQLIAQVTISNKQAAWCLENADKVEILTESLLIKDSIINIQNDNAIRYEVMISSFKTIVNNDSLTKVSQKALIQEERQENKDLRKNNTRLKVKNTFLGIGIAAETLLLILALLL